MQMVMASAHRADADDDGAPNSCVGCLADLDGDDDVDGIDLIILLGNWGPCPCAVGIQAASLREAFEDACLVWPDDWNATKDALGTALRSATIVVGRVRQLAAIGLP